MRHPQPQSQPAFPPCPYCGKPCWETFPPGATADMVAAFKGRTLLSTCQEGQQHDLNAVGWCYGAMCCIIESRARD